MSAQHPLSIELISNKAPPKICVAMNSHAAMLAAVRQLNLYAALPLHSISSSLLTKSIRLATKQEIRNDVHRFLPESDLPNRQTIGLSKFMKQQIKILEETVR